MQRTSSSQKLRRWQDFLMTFDCTIKHTAGKDTYITDTFSRIYKYLCISTTKDNLIPYSIDSTTIRPFQEITIRHINVSDCSTTSSSTSGHTCNNMLARGAINFTCIDCDFNKCRGGAETTGHYHSCSLLDEEDMELTSTGLQDHQEEGQEGVF